VFDSLPGPRFACSGLPQIHSFSPSPGKSAMRILSLSFLTTAVVMTLDEKGEKFEKAAYSATLTFNVAELLP